MKECKIEEKKIKSIGEERERISISKVDEYGIRRREVLLNRKALKLCK